MQRFIYALNFIFFFAISILSANAQTGQTVSSGSATDPILFSAPGCTYSWVNSNPAIGLVANGSGNIPSFTAVNIGNSPITATITATPAESGFIFASNPYTNSVAVVNAITNAVVTNIQVGGGPSALSVSPDGSRLYVVNTESANVSVINTATDQVIATIPVGSYPYGVVVSPDGKTIYVTDQASNSISVINAASNMVTSTIVLSQYAPWGISISADGAKLVTADYNSNSISVINTANQAVQSVGVGTTPIGIATSSKTGLVYVANFGSDNISVVNVQTNTVVATIPVGTAPMGVTVNPDGTSVYVTNSGSNTVSVINTATNQVTSTITVGQTPEGISTSPDGSLVYVFNTNVSTMSVISTASNSVLTTNTVSNGQYSIGNFIAGCTPETFTITVNPANAPVVASTLATGTISACAGSASASPHIQQFTVSGGSLTGSIIATAPAGFEVSLSSGSGFANNVSIPQTAGTVSGTVVYVRSAAADPAGSISGNVTLSSTGATDQTVAVKGTVNALPTVNAVANQTVNNGAATAAVNFNGTGNTFTWVNDTPGIGLAASGSGNIASFTAVNTGTSPVIAKITATPSSVGYAYIANTQSNNVSVINTTTNTVEASIDMGAEPYGVAVTPNGHEVYVTNYGSGTVSVINTTSNTVIATIPVGTNPMEVTVSPDGSYVYVGMPNTTSVSVISTATKNVIGTINLSGYLVAGLSVSQDGKWLYATGPNQNAVLIVNLATNALVNTITVGGQSGVWDVAVSPVGNRVYVSGGDNDNLLVINPLNNALIATIPLGYPALGCAVSPDGSRVYVANEYNNMVSVINTANNTVVTTIPVGTSPDGISVSPDGSSVYVVNAESNSVSVISTATNTVTKTVPVGQSPLSVGNFITAGTNCTGSPVTFTITVNPANAPVVASTLATGTISACAGSASASPHIQQFTVSGNRLTGDITAMAPAGFEISLAPGSGYGTDIVIAQAGGAVSNTVVYVRAAAGAATGSISGNVTLTSAGATDQTVAVTGTVNALPTVNAVGNQILASGSVTAGIDFTGTANTFTWVNDTPGIGLAASGMGDIASFTAINNGNTPVTATITVTPSVAQYAYIPSGSGVSVINTLTDTPLPGTISIANAYGVTVSPDGAYVYISGDGADGLISIISTLTNKVVGTIAAGNTLGDVTISADGRKLYVASYPASILVIDTKTQSVINTIPADDPSDIALSPDGSKLWVVNPASGTVTINNTATNAIINVITVGQHPIAVTLSSDGSLAYVTVANSNYVSVINTATYKVLSTIPVGTFPTGLVLSADGSVLYVVNGGSNSVSVINTSTGSLIATIGVGSDPDGISISPDGSHVIVSNSNSGSVSIVNIANNTVEATVPVGGTPVSFGNFIIPGSGCTGAPVKFTITVNPSTPTITASAVTGTISACSGAASASPNIQQFTVLGSGLTGNITINAPTGFEISLNAAAGYGSSLTLNQAGGAVSNTIVYVRSAASLPNGPTTANVLLSSQDAPGQTVSVTATVNPMVTASLVISASANNICAGTSVTFTAAPANGGSAPVYQWLLNGNNAGTNSLTFSSSNIANGDIVSCIMTGNSVCITPAAVTSNSITMNVAADVIPSVSITVSQNNICAGTMLTFTATPVNGGNAPVYQWLVNGNNAGTNSLTFSGRNFNNGDQVSCVINSNAACAMPASATSNTVKISVNPVVSPAISITASQNNICQGANITFTATPTNEGSSPVYQWLVNGNAAGTNSPTFATGTLSNGDIVSCRLTSNATCLAIANATSNDITIVVNAHVVPTVGITVSENNVCAGTPVTFTASATNGGTSPVYQWLLNGNKVGTNSTTFNSDAFANGDVVSCVVTGSSVCAAPAGTTSNSITMNVFPLPLVDAGGNKTIEKGGSVALTATASANVTDITWSPSAGLDNNKILTPNANPVSTTLYTITVQTADGCMATASVTVTVFFGITIPNTFTPNGDGINDKWDIQNLIDYPNCMVLIFDRYGGEVYNSKGYYNPWDGTLKGQPLPVGTYYYLINLNNGTPPLSGFVALIR